MIITHYQDHIIAKILTTMTIVPDITQLLCFDFDGLGLVHVHLHLQRKERIEMVFHLSIVILRVRMKEERDVRLKFYK